MRPKTRRRICSRLRRELLLRWEGKRMNPSSPGSGVTRRNQRSSRRQVAKGSTKAVAFGNPLGLGRNIASAVLDVSETGARLVLVQQLEQGAEFEVNFEGPGSKPVK